MGTARFGTGRKGTLVAVGGSGRAPVGRAPDPTPAERAGLPPGELAGFRVAVAGDRRRHELAELIEEYGARAVCVQAVRPVAQPDVAAVTAATVRCLAEPVHEVVVSSAFGLRTWLGIARRAGLADALVAQLAQARLLARDTRAADELRELGLSQIWSTATPTTEDLFRYLSAQPVIGRRVVAQLDNQSQRELCDALRTAGATVVEIGTARAERPNHLDILRRLSDLVIRRQVDAVALTSEAATRNLLWQAGTDDTLSELLNALVADVTPACLGPLTAAPLRAHGVAPLIAPAPMMRSLAGLLAAELPRRTLTLRAGGYPIEVRGQAIVVAGRLVPMQPGPVAVLRALAQRPGHVLSSAEIRALVPGWSTVDDHAIEMAVSRLRRTLAETGLDDLDIVHTVMKRGYRLAV